MRCKICLRALVGGLCFECCIRSTAEQKQRREETNKAIDDFQAAKLQEAMDERVEPSTPKRWGHLRRIK